MFAGLTKPHSEVPPIAYKKKKERSAVEGFDPPLALCFMHCLTPV